MKSEIYLEKLVCFTSLDAIFLFSKTGTEFELISLNIFLRHISRECD